jgi:environmental stress-induced protein Ves
MTARAIALDSVRPQPWRNVGGMTRELLALPDGSDWNVRLSVADIDANGAFSAFPGVVRWFAVFEGAGVDLDFQSGSRRITRTDPPLRFEGDAAPMCRLVDGPTRDLNLMLRNADGAMALAIDHRPWSPAGQACGLFAVVDGVCHAGARPERVLARTLLWYGTPPPVLRFAADNDTGAPVGFWVQWSTRKR